MLHEVLIILSGQQSGIVTGQQDDGTGIEGYIHPTEQALLKRAHELGLRNRNLQNGINEVMNNNGGGKKYATTTQGCIKCLDEEVVQKFSQDLVDLESKILHRDSSMVGGDNMVSLSTVVGTMAIKWERRFKYSVDLMEYLKAGNNKSTSQLHDRLSKDLVTGYSDIKELSSKLITAVERNWVYQLKNWLGYGKINRINEEDFFIHYINKTATFEITQDLVPRKLITEKAMNDAFLIGKSINLMNAAGSSNGTNTIMTFAQVNDFFQWLEFPIESSIKLQKIIDEMKGLVYEKIIKNTLPVEKIQMALKVFKLFLLLESTEFAEGLMVADTTSHRLLANSLSGYVEDSTDIDKLEKYNFAKGVLSLSSSEEGDEFSDFVCNIHTTMEIQLYWPYNILLDPVGANTYSLLFHYLFALEKTRKTLVRGGWKSIMKKKTHHDSESIQSVYRANLFLDAMWAFAQNSVLNANFESILMHYLNTTQNVLIDDLISKQSNFLTLSCQELFLDDAEFRRLMRKFLVNCNLLAETAQTGKSHLVEQKSTTVDELNESMRAIVNLIESADQIYSDKLNTLLLQLESVMAGL